MCSEWKQLYSTVAPVCTVQTQILILMCFQGLTVVVIVNIKQIHFSVVLIKMQNKQSLYTNCWNCTNISKTEGFKWISEVKKKNLFSVTRGYLFFLVAHLFECHLADELVLIQVHW